jgi:hypothetical protein
LEGLNRSVVVAVGEICLGMGLALRAGDWIRLDVFDALECRTE